MPHPPRTTILVLPILAGALALTGCGGSGGPDEAEARPADGPRAELSTSRWMSVDREANSVELDVVSGASDANEGWNFNGYAGGGGRITVPEGARVTIHFRNADDISPHSLVVAEPRDPYPGRFNGADPAFEGAASDEPTTMEGATQPGSSETISFTASESGEYALICYQPGHANGGHWIHFRVSGAGSAGFREL